MSILGLHVGVSFAEFSLLDDHDFKRIAFHRVYLPRSPLKTALQKFLQKYSETPVSKIFFASNHIEKLAPFRLGGSTAHLVTEGWENLSWLSQTAKSLMNTQRLPAVQSQDLVFGVKERVSAQGEILEPLNLEYISQVITKLKLMEVRRVCIHFLHSQKNPQHLQQSKELLQAQGFKVYTAHFDSDRDIEKSRRLSLSSGLGGTWDDFSTDLKQGPAVYVLNQNGFVEIDQAEDPLENLASLDHLWAFFKKKNILYLGLETFLQIFPQDVRTFWDSPWGPVYRPHGHKKTLLTQPTSLLQINFWNELDFHLSAEGFEPGPIALGRGQKLTAFDLYFEDLVKDPELSDWLSVTASSKIISNLTALAKTSKENLGSSAMMAHLKDHFLKRLQMELTSPQDALGLGFWTKLLAPSLRLPVAPYTLSEAIARAGVGAPL